MYARLSVLRPLLVSEAKRCSSRATNHEESSRSNQRVDNILSKELCTMCISTAHEVLKVLDGQLHTVYRSSPWHSLYCKEQHATLRLDVIRQKSRTNCFVVTFAAASALVAATLCPDLGARADEAPFQNSWDRARRIFDFHKESCRVRREGY